MQALTLTAIKSPLELVERDAPDPAEGEVVVTVKAAALNRRDYWITRGMYPGIQTPVVLGSDLSGVVSRCGDGVNSSWSQQEVIVNPGLDWGEASTHQAADFNILGMPRDGTFAEEVAVPATHLHPRPAHLDWPEAAALPLAGVTAYRALFVQGGLQAGENVLVTGIGGGVATFALQFALAAGAKVWVTSSSDQKIENAVALGAEGGFNYKQEDWHQRAAKVMSPDLIIDSAGGAQYNSLIQLSAAGGRLVNYGATTGAVEKLDLFKVFWKQLQLKGSSMGSPVDFDRMVEFVNEHQIKPVVDRTYPLSAGNEALSHMKAGDQFGKIVLLPG